MRTPGLNHKRRVLSSEPRRSRANLKDPKPLAASDKRLRVIRLPIWFRASPNWWISVGVIGCHELVFADFHSLIIEGDAVLPEVSASVSFSRQKIAH